MWGILELVSPRNIYGASLRNVEFIAERLSTRQIIVRRISFVCMYVCMYVSLYVSRLRMQLFQPKPQTYAHVLLKWHCCYYSPAVHGIMCAIFPGPAILTER